MFLLLGSISPHPTQPAQQLIFWGSFAGSALPIHHKAYKDFEPWTSMSLDHQSSTSDVMTRRKRHAVVGSNTHLRFFSTGMERVGYHSEKLMSRFGDRLEYRRVCPLIAAGSNKYVAVVTRCVTDPGMLRTEHLFCKIYGADRWTKTNKTLGGRL